MPAYRRASFIQECSVGAVSYKAKRKSPEKFRTFEVPLAGLEPDSLKIRKHQ